MLAGYGDGAIAPQDLQNIFIAHPELFEKVAQEKVVREFTFNVSEASFLIAQQFAVDNAGKPYGVLEICGLFLSELALLFGIKMQNPFKDAGSTWICDQLQAALLEKCTNVQLSKPINDMTPKDMYALVSTLPTNLT